MVMVFAAIVNEGGDSFTLDSLIDQSKSLYWCHTCSIIAYLTAKHLILSARATFSRDCCEAPPPRFSTHRSRGQYVANPNVIILHALCRVQVKKKNVIIADCVQSFRLTAIGKDRCADVCVSSTEGSDFLLRYRLHDEAVRNRICRKQKTNLINEDRNPSLATPYASHDETVNSRQTMSVEVLRSPSFAQYQSY